MLKRIVTIAGLLILCFSFSSIDLKAQYTCGDANGDGTANVSDGVYIIGYIFVGGTAPDPLIAADVNCDSIVDVSDAIWIIRQTFCGGPIVCDCVFDTTDPNNPDTIRVDHVEVISQSSAQEVSVPVTIYNDEEIEGGSFGLYYDSDDVTIDSVSLKGGGAESQTSVCQTDPAQKLALVGFYDAFCVNHIPLGDTLLATLYFTVDANAPEQVVTIDSGFFEPSGYVCLTKIDGYSLYPQFKFGSITISEDTCAEQKPGDADSDGMFSIDDASYITDFLCSGGPAPDPISNGDANGDCVIDTTDASYIMAYLFGGGPAPVECTCLDPDIIFCGGNPCDSMSTDPVFLICPAGDVPFRVYLKDEFGDPIVGDSSVFVVLENCSGLIRCPSTPYGDTLFAPAPSNESGVITFYADGGNCDDSCQAKIVRPSCPIPTIATVPVKMLDIDGDLGVSYFGDYDYSLCNDYNGNGALDFEDQSIFFSHVCHYCGLSPCDRFSATFNIYPDTNITPGGEIELELALSNNNFDTCYVGLISFFKREEFGSGGSEELITSVPYNSSLLPGQEDTVTVTDIADSAFGSVFVRFSTDCCDSVIELERNIKFGTPATCVYGENVCYYFRIWLEDLPVEYYELIPDIPAGWYVDTAYLPTLPVMAPDSISYYICTPDLTDWGIATSVQVVTCDDVICSDPKFFETYVYTYSSTGDANADCKVNVSDAVLIINYAFAGGIAPDPCIAGDPNGDVKVNVSDAVYITNYAFSGGTPPVQAYPPPYPNCP